MKKDLALATTAAVMTSPCHVSKCKISLSCKVRVRRNSWLAARLKKSPSRKKVPTLSNEQAADDLAIGEHVIVLVLPLAGGAAGRRAVEDQHARWRRSRRVGGGGGRGAAGHPRGGLFLCA